MDKCLGKNAIGDVAKVRAAPITVNQRSSVKLNKFFGENVMAAVPAAVEAKGIAPLRKSWAVLPPLLLQMTLAYSVDFLSTPVPHNT